MTCGRRVGASRPSPSNQSCKLPLPRHCTSSPAARSVSTVSSIVGKPLSACSSSWSWGAPTAAHDVALHEFLGAATPGVSNGAATTTRSLTRASSRRNAPRCAAARARVRRSTPRHRPHRLGSVAARPAEDEDRVVEPLVVDHDVDADRDELGVEVSSQPDLSPTSRMRQRPGPRLARRARARSRRSARNGRTTSIPRTGTRGSTSPCGTGGEASSTATPSPPHCRKQPRPALVSGHGLSHSGGPDDTGTAARCQLRPTVTDGGSAYGDPPAPAGPSPGSPHRVRVLWARPWVRVAVAGAALLVFVVVLLSRREARSRPTSPNT